MWLNVGIEAKELFVLFFAAFVEICNYFTKIFFL